MKWKFNTLLKPDTVAISSKHIWKHKKHTFDPSGPGKPLCPWFPLLPFFPSSPWQNNCKDVEVVLAHDLTATQHPHQSQALSKHQLPGDPTWTQPGHPRFVKALQNPAQSLSFTQNVLIFLSSEWQRTFVWIYKSSVPPVCAQMVLIHSIFQCSCYFSFKTLKETFFKSRLHFFLSGESSSFYIRRPIILWVRRYSSSNLEQSRKPPPTAPRHGSAQQCSYNQKELCYLPLKLSALGHSLSMRLYCEALYPDVGSRQWRTLSLGLWLRSLAHYW